MKHKIIYKNIKKLIPLLVCLGLPSTVHAEESGNSSTAPFSYLGLLAGGSRIADSDGETKPAVGITFGAKVAPNLGIGVIGTYFREASSGSFLGLNTGSSVDTYVAAGQLNYFFDGLHLGGEVGMIINSWASHISTLHTGDSKTSLTYGPVIGYDFIVARSFSVGAEGHYLFHSADGGVDNIQGFIALKFWQ